MFDRSKYRASEMPQAFRYEIIKKAYEQVCLDATFYLLKNERLSHFPRIPICLWRQGQKQPSKNSRVFLASILSAQQQLAYSFWRRATPEASAFQFFHGGN